MVKFVCQVGGEGKKIWAFKCECLTALLVMECASPATTSAMIHVYMLPDLKQDVYEQGV